MWLPLQVEGWLPSSGLDKLVHPGRHRWLWKAVACVHGLWCASVFSFAKRLEQGVPSGQLVPKRVSRDGGAKWGRQVPFLFSNKQDSLPIPGRGRECEWEAFSERPSTQKLDSTEGESSTRYYCLEVTWPPDLMLRAVTSLELIYISPRRLLVHRPWQIYWDMALGASGERLTKDMNVRYLDGRICPLCWRPLMMGGHWKWILNSLS